MRRIATHDQLPGSRLIVPDTARDRISRSQYEIVSLGGQRDCLDEDCERPHVEGRHPLHPSVTVGAWVLTRERAAHALPNDDTHFLVSLDDLLAVFP